MTPDPRAALEPAEVIGPILAIDVVGSSNAVEFYGQDASVGITEDLERIEGRILRDGLHRVGATEGDGLLIGGTASHDELIALLRALMEFQNKPHFYPRHIALGYAVTLWDRAPADPAAVYRGTQPAITLVKRIQAECPAGGIAITEDVYRVLSFKVPELRDRFEAQEHRALKGIAHPVTFYLFQGRGAAPVVGTPKPAEVDRAQLLGLTRMVKQIEDSVWVLAAEMRAGFAESKTSWKTHLEDDERRFTAGAARFNEHHLRLERLERLRQRFFDGAALAAILVGLGVLLWLVGRGP